MFQKPEFGANTSDFGTFNSGTTTASPFGGLKLTTGTSALEAPPAFVAVASTQPATGGGLFGATNTTGGLFGGASAATPPAGGLFDANNTSSGLFGNAQNNSAFDAKPPGGFGQQQAVNGTAHTKYSPVVGTDEVVQSGDSQNININHHCITSMKEYENKSLEELRLEDYTAGRKGSTSSDLGEIQQPTENKPLFGANTSFGQPATTSAPSVCCAGGLSTGVGCGQTNTFSFGGTTSSGTTGGLFGAAKPAFGATAAPAPAPAATGLFGTAPQSAPAPAFGTATSTFGFGSTLQTQQSGGLVDAKPTSSVFGAAPASSGFGPFGSTGLYGVKPQQTTAPAFGAAQPAVGMMGGGFGTTTSTAGGLFGGNNSFGKPAASQPNFGFNMQPMLGYFRPTTWPGETHSESSRLFGAIISNEFLRVPWQRRLECMQELIEVLKEYTIQ